MITLIHGDDTDKSREKLNELLVGKTNILKFDFGKSTYDQIINALESQDLFENEKTIVLENFKKNAILDKVLPFIILQKNKSLNIILWSDSALDMRLVVKLVDAKILLFSLPKYLFPFLDDLSPKNSKKSLETMMKLRAQMADELIFFMLIKRIRVLILLKTGKSGDFEETKNMQDWQLSRMSKQVNAWDKERLISFYKKLFELEVGMKTSNLPMNLGQHLDILLLSYLN